MADALTLYFCPMTCARVTMVALERSGAAYHVRLINLMAGEQRAPDYLAVNPMGKVPALRIGDRVLTENAAILLYLDGAYPEAGLLPHAIDPVEVATARSDLIWCATSLHPLVRQIRAPAHYTLGDQDAVRAKGVEAVAPILARFEARFAAADWWFGPAWSIVDTYIAWAVAGWATAIDLAPYPSVAAHGGRVAAQPAFGAMLAREAALMAEAGMQLPPGMAR